MDPKYPLGVLATIRLAAMLLSRNRRILQLKDPAETLVPREVELLVSDLLKRQLGLGSPSSTNTAPRGRRGGEGRGGGGEKRGGDARRYYYPLTVRYGLK